mgnify:CR=1 FL=1
MNRYLRPREVRRREQARRADIEYRTYVGPLGIRGHDLVQLPGGTLEKVVGNVSGRTFAPGTIVPIGRHQDDFGEVILGASPPGRGGAFPLIRTTGALGSPLAEPLEALGYHHDGAGLWSLILYRSGSPYEVVETLASFDTGDAAVAQFYPIATDSAGKVGDNSLAYGVGAAASIAELAVVDLVGESVYHRAAAGGRFSTGAHFAGGWLYWAEFDQSTEDDQIVRGYKARADFTDVEALGTATVPNEVTEQGWALQWSAATAAGIHLELYWEDTGNEEVSGFARFRLPIAGGAGSSNAPSGGFGTLEANPGIPVADGGALLPSFDGVYHVEDSASAAPTLEWPAEWGVVTVRNLAVADGSTYAMYDDGDALRFARALDGGPYGEAPAALEAIVNLDSAPKLFVPR